MARPSAAGWAHSGIKKEKETKRESTRVIKHTHTHTQLARESERASESESESEKEVRVSGVRGPLFGVKQKDLRYRARDGDCDASISSSKCGGK